jgi:hypothetical protein
VLLSNHNSTQKTIYLKKKVLSNIFDDFQPTTSK